MMLAMVCDLPVPGGTVEDQAGSPLRRFDRLVLAAVGVQDVIRHHRVGNGVQVAGSWQSLGSFQADRLITGDCPADIMLDDLVLVLAEVNPHRDLLKAEDSQRTLVEDFPVCLIADGVLDGGEISQTPRRGVAVLVVGQVREPHGQVVAHQLGERVIGQHLLFLELHEPR